MNNTEIRNELFQISNFVTRLLVENVDEETGEIKDEKIFAFLQTADVKKAELISTATVSLKHYRDLAQHVANKIKQLSDIKKSYSQFENTLKNVLIKFVEPNETIESDQFRLSWRKSTTVEKDLFLDMEEFAKKFPELVKISYELNKMEIKKIAKAGPIPEGIKLVTNNNIQIK